MKSEDIRKFLFVNPSPNMFLLSKHIKSFGYDVEYVTTVNSLNNKSLKLYYFYNEKITHFDLTVLEQEANDSKSYLFKNNFINNLKYKSYKSEFASILPGFPIGNFVDLQLLKKQRVKDILPIPSKTVNSFEDVLNQNSDYFIVLSWIPYELYSDSSNVENITIYETDMDIKSCFGSEYFIIFINNKRIELFCIENKVYLVAFKGISSLDLLKQKFSFLSKFSFILKDEFQIIRNRQPWVKTKKNVLLLNDYSFFNLSVKMSDNWYESLGRHLCIGKL
jgi:hypothetical protein